MIDLSLDRASATGVVGSRWREKDALTPSPNPVHTGLSSGAVINWVGHSGPWYDAHAGSGGLSQGTWSGRPKG